jgi:hypothetical protein
LFKSYLEKRYLVVADRADLYSYFFELGVRLLKPGGRLGYICSSTFFRTRAGRALRRYLLEESEIETIVDFGDLQVFGGVTTYPAIITLRRANGEMDGHNLRFIKAEPLPDDLSKAFTIASHSMPCAQLGAGSWRFESNSLDQVRKKMAAGRKTLAEVYGPPLYGIKTGLNDAFIVTREQRDALIARDARSADLLKPFLIGENLKRWRVESDDLWLIYTPKSRVDIEKYPAIRDHLAGFQEALERRATKQNWWELQQAQAAYEPSFIAGGLTFPDISQGPKFSIASAPSYIDCTAFRVHYSGKDALPILGSKASWFFLFGLSNPLRGGIWRLRLKTQYVGSMPVPGMSAETTAEMNVFGNNLSEMAAGKNYVLKGYLHRVSDVCGGRKVPATFVDTLAGDFDNFRQRLKRVKVEIPVTERDEWERYFNARKAEVKRLSDLIASAEAEINDRVYRLFDLDRDEVALIEEALAGQY